ncbi:hypothetical protein M7I_0375 [Glarea lozoyensis 74030]|uniref:Uncharacterized protein n=1 Tax=Glarea lozoyensis (strain ATCC 74030 / MF5533) TaxID=1104152 RepID=H0ED74_GLAL7|nr:hypothetical protein M7I_0375 [Glarea lozoyensis 74030]
MVPISQPGASIHISLARSCAQDFTFPSWSCVYEIALYDFHHGHLLSNADAAIMNSPEQENAAVVGPCVTIHLGTIVSIMRSVYDPVVLPVYKANLAARAK